MVVNWSSKSKGHPNGWPFFLPLTVNNYQQREADDRIRTGDLLFTKQLLYH